MNFMVDENLPRQVAVWLTNGGRPAWHVSELGLLGKPDEAVWAEAIARTAFVVTRDSDFLVLARSSSQSGVIRLLIGNCATPTLLARLASLWPELELRLTANERIIEIG